MPNATASTDDTAVGTTVSSTRRAYEALRDAILTGRLEPGERLRVDRLKDMLNTGASPIREALSLLTSDQLVERQDQRGFRVTPVSVAQFEEILALRCSLEVMALMETLKNADKTWEEALVLAHHRLSRAAQDNSAEFERFHKAFHMALLSHCASPILLKFCNQLYDLNIRYRYLAGKSGTYSRRKVSREHSEIMYAALDRDTDLTATRLTQHYRRTGEFLAGQLSGI